ncbi:serine/threonine protein kinase [bacterium]|nr:serine/threonine protein kinase [bacterium]
MDKRVIPPETLEVDLGRGQLEKIQLIATGGMAYVYRAYQPALDRYIVVKRLKDELLTSPETRERFRREARALASVLHHNIAHVYDFIELPGQAFILMEHIEGIDLSYILEKIGNLPPVVAAAILLGVARGLQHIHASDLIHRDIKPSNIRINQRGTVKLMDFGIVLEISNTSLTRPGMMVGSPSYLSPEQVLGDVITAASDIFLLGITFYEMLTGSRPFRAEHGNTVFQSIREGNYIQARKMNGKVPVALDKVVNRCLKLDPADRYDSVRDLIVALEAYLGPHISSHPEELIMRFLDTEALLAIPSTTGELKHKPSGLSWPLVAAGAAAALFLGIGLYYTGYRSGRLVGHAEQAAVQALDAKSPSVSRVPKSLKPSKKR